MSAQRLLAAVLWGVTAFAAVYLLQGALRIPGLLYDPTAHRWLVGPVPVGVQMRYYSDVAGASLAALLAGLVRARGKEPGDLTLLVSSALSVVALDVAFFLSRVLSALRG